MSGYGMNQPPYQGGPVGQPGYGYQQYPEQSQATTVLILGILGLVVCGICAPFAWVMGNREIEGIDAGRRPPDNRQTAKIGQILGIIGTAIIGLTLLLVVGFFVLAIIGAAAGA